MNRPLHAYLVLGYIVNCLPNKWLYNRAALFRVLLLDAQCSGAASGDVDISVRTIFEQKAGDSVVTEGRSWDLQDVTSLLDLARSPAIGSGLG